MYSLGHSVQESEIRGEQGGLLAEAKVTGGSCAGSPASVVCFPFFLFHLSSVLSAGV